MVDALLDALGSQPGVRLAEPGEFTRRALANGRIDLTQAEGLADLLEAETEAQRKARLLMAEGGLRRQIEDGAVRLLDLSAGPRWRSIMPTRMRWRRSGAPPAHLARHPNFGAWLTAPRVEPLRDGVRVVVAGPPNAGKSSLVNASRAASGPSSPDIAGTTRDLIEVPLSLDGVPILLIDTAGLRDDPMTRSSDRRRSRGEIERADLLLWLGGPDEEAPSPVGAGSSRASADRTHGPRRLYRVSAYGGGLALDSVHPGRAFAPGEGATRAQPRAKRMLMRRERGLRGTAIDHVAARRDCDGARGAFDQLTGRAGSRTCSTHCSAASVSAK